jgi:hypothetical protein
VLGVPFPYFFSFYRLKGGGAVCWRSFAPFRAFTRVFVIMLLGRPDVITKSRRASG